MRVKVLEKLQRYTLVQPIATIILCHVELHGKDRAYMVCYEQHGHAMHMQGHYFINKGEANAFFELHKKEVDLALEMTSQEKADYATYQPRTHREMAEYING